MTRTQAVCVGVVGATWVGALIAVTVAHPKPAAVTFVVIVGAVLIAVREDGKSIGRGFDEINTPHCDRCGALTHHNERRCRDCRQEAQ
jgi:hypothetical protein